MKTNPPGDLPAIEESVGQILMRALYDRLQRQVEHAAQVAVRRLATAGFAHIVAQIDSLAIKDEAKAVFALPRGTQEIHTLADRVGSKALIVFADPAEYTGGMDQFRSMADQPQLPLEE